MDFKLRPYQAKAVSEIIEACERRVNPLYVLATGGGKSVIIGKTTRQFVDMGLNVHLWVHRNRLVSQLAETMKHEGFNPGIIQGSKKGNYGPVQVASVRSLINREASSIQIPDVVITDECFIAGTLVNGTPIERVKIGQSVTTYNVRLGLIEQKRVLNTFKNLANNLLKVTIRLKDGSSTSLVCTENHPFYVNGCWIPAKDLNNGSTLINLSSLRESVRVSQKSEKILQQNLSINSSFTKQSQEKRRNSKSNVDREPNEERRSKRQGFSNIEEDKAQTFNSRREWKRYDQASEAPLQQTRCSRGRVHFHDFNAKGFKLPSALQNRFSYSLTKASNRSRWTLSQRSKEERTRQKENSVSRDAWVESVEVYQPTSFRRPRSVYVYNLEVQGNNNYFANGILVHNCHHMAEGNTYSALLEKFKPKHTVGFTATPCRLDGKGLGDFYDELIEGPNAKWLIENNFLSPFTMLACPSPLTDATAKRRKGDFVTSELWDRLDSSELNGNLVRDYKLHIPGKTCIVFTMNKTHAEQVLDAYRSAGITAVTILDHHSDQERKEAFDAFTSGRAKVLINVNILTEGVDLPGVDAVQIAFKTQSITKYLQAIGRALRLSPGKTMAYILDHGGNCLNPALPWPNSDIKWSLDETPIILEDDEIELRDKETGEVSKVDKDEFNLTELGDHLEVIDLESLQEAHRLAIIERQIESYQMHKDTCILRGNKPISAYYRLKEQYKSILSEDTLTYIAKDLGYNWKWRKHQMKILNQEAEF